MNNEIQAAKYLYHCLVKNKFIFSFQARSYPEEEEFSLLRIIEPYCAEYNPDCPLGKPQNHSENPATLLPIPTLLSLTCLDKDQYPWNVLCSGPDALEWYCTRHSLYKQHSVAALKSQRPSPPHFLSQVTMSTITSNAQQSSYP